MDRTFTTRSGFKASMWVLAIPCILLIVMIPFAIMALWMAYRGKVRVTDDKIIVSWLGTREHPWSDIGSLSRVRAPGFIGGLMAPISYGLRSKPRAAPRIPLGAFEAGDELLGIIQAKTGQTLAA